MKLARQFLDGLHKVPGLNKATPLLEAMDAGIFGPAETTEKHGPHLVDCVDIKRYMSWVIAALIPATVAAVVLFGWWVLVMILVSYVVGGAVEVIFAIVRKKEIHEGFLITGLIFPLVLPPTTPLWIVAVGVVFGVLFGKEMFGGTGRNIFNPALVGRLFVTIAFPAIMTSSWQMPFSDATTSATPLGAYKTEQTVVAASDLLFGATPGCMGETFRIGIIAGGLLLILMKVSNWRIPVTYIGSVLLFAWIGNDLLAEKFPLLAENIAPPVFQVLSGGLLFGAFFMATDPVTSPFTKAGKYLFGTLCGVLTVLIRSFSGNVEGVMFSIVVMNAFTPLIDHVVLACRYRPVKA